MSEAESSRNRVRIRQWSRVRYAAVGMVFLGFALPVGTLAVVGSVPSLNSDPSLGPVLGWAFGGGLALFVIGVLLDSEAQGRVQVARFAGGHRSVGVVEHVNQEPSTEAGGIVTFMLVISAEAPGPVRIHRRLYSDHYPADSRVRVGQTVIFRHVTVDPDDLNDIQFVTFGGGLGRRRHRPPAH